VFAQDPESVDLAEAWIEGDGSARWRSASGHGPTDGARDSGSSVLEVDAGCRLPRHTDSAEETIVVTLGRARVRVGDDHQEVAAGGVALVPREVPHEVQNSGDGPLRFVAVYAASDVVTTYEDEVQPEGSRERRPVS
jgi:quercetin dioxygenase-like cupin family protein